MFPTWFRLLSLALIGINLPFMLDVERIGLVAIGRAFTADLCLARLALYRDDPGSE